MAKKKINSTIDQTVNTENIANVINGFKSFFKSDVDFIQFKDYILYAAPNIIKKHQNNDDENFFVSSLLEIKMHALYYISQKIKNGDIDLEIKIIETYYKHIGSILPIYRSWLTSDQHHYLDSLQKEKTINPNVEKEFISKLWEDCIIETIQNYKGLDIFTIEILRNFKHKLLHIEEYFKQYSNNEKTLKIGVSK